jgi:hypothetical protein
VLPPRPLPTSATQSVFLHPALNLFREGRDACPKGDIRSLIINSRMTTMTSLKTLALAAVAVAGLGMFASTDAEARGGRGFGGGFRAGGFGGMRHFGGHRHFGGRHLHFGHRHHFHRHHHHHRHGHWRHRHFGFGVAVVGSSCYRYRWYDTPYGPVRRLVNICVY